MLDHHNTPAPLRRPHRLHRLVTGDPDAAEPPHRESLAHRLHRLVTGDPDAVETAEPDVVWGIEEILRGGSGGVAGARCRGARCRAVNWRTRLSRRGSGSPPGGGLRATVAAAVGLPVGDVRQALDAAREADRRRRRAVESSRITGSATSP